LQVAGDADFDELAALDKIDFSVIRLVGHSVEFSKIDKMLAGERIGFI
jgi:hypothetical protein